MLEILSTIGIIILIMLGIIACVFLAFELIIIIASVRQGLKEIKTGKINIINDIKKEIKEDDNK